MTTVEVAPVGTVDPSPEAALRGGTRWRRVVVLLAPGLIVVALLAIATLQGVLPLNLAVSGQNFKVSSNGARVDVPKGLTMYPSTVRMKNGGTTEAVVIAGLPEAVLTKGMCVSLVVTLPAIGSWTVQLHTSGRTVAKDMTLDGASFTASSADLVPKTTDGRPGTVNNLVVPVAIGKDASELGGVGSGPAGRFGIDAPGSGNLDALQADARGAIIAGTATLSGLTVNIHHGRGRAHGECF